MEANQLNTVIIASSSIMAVIISGAISFLVCKWQLARQNVSSEEARLNSEITNILKIQIEYPYLENRQFANDWSSNKVVENNKERFDYQRYDSYCCLIFNFISQIYDLYGGDKAKIENFFAVEEEANIHQKWWVNPLNPRDNIEGYAGGFRDYINSILKKG